jgi:hypothetical protein
MAMKRARLVGINVDGSVKRGFPTPSGRLEFYSSTMNSWGWPSSRSLSTSRVTFTKTISRKIRLF